MPNRITPIEVDSIYHIYNRGVNKGLIFFNEKNYQYFIYKMAYHFQEKASVLAYCLMPNHFHLIIKVIDSNFIQKGLQPFMIAYSRAINNEQNRIGPLFQGHYQSNLIDDDSYLLECIKYIHLNPVKAGIVERPQDWQFSSYKQYLSNNKLTMIDSSFIFHFFDTINEFVEFSEDDNGNNEPKYFIDY
jgi:REP element-mobilizing transposase RayT